jgi:hypothetical protein
MSDYELARLDVMANVNYAGVGVVSISAHSKFGSVITGSLTPNKAHELSGVILQEAETAYSLDILYSLLRDMLDLDDDVIADFIKAFKKSREE